MDKELETKETLYQAELAKISVDEIRTYLVSGGWKKVSVCADYSELYQKEDGSMLQLPVVVGKWPYYMLLATLIESLAVIEGVWYPYLVMKFIQKTQKPIGEQNG